MMRRLLDATHDALAEAWRELWRARNAPDLACERPKQWRGNEG